MGQKTMLTLDNLYQFFVEQNKSVTFSAQETGKPIVVRTQGVFEASDVDMPGMMKLKLKVCHTELNRNGSYISEENMKKAMPTLKYRPILAYIHTLPDGTEDFYAHNMEIVEDENGDEKIVYIENQVGCFTADEPWLEYDEGAEKTYVIAYAVIPEEYTSAADIIRRKNGTKVSCELVIEDLVYNAKEKYLDLVSFYFGGTTLLGADENGNAINEGMLGSRADIDDFCHDAPVFTYQDKMIEVLEKLNVTLSEFNTQIQQKGGSVMGKFEELLAKYGKTSEDITFEIEGLADEELEAKFAELFEEKKFTKTFSIELSHDDIRQALYALLVQFESENECYYIREVYDNYFVMCEWYSNKLYKQNYVVEEEAVTFDGDRVEVYEILVTAEERDALDALKANYASLEEKYNELKAFKDGYDAAELKAQKDAIFAKEAYECLAENKAFKDLIADAENYSVEECEAKAKEIFADHVISEGQFAVKAEKSTQSKTLPLNFNAKTTKRKGYGNLFNN